MSAALALIRGYRNLLSTLGKDLTRRKRLDPFKGIR